MQGNNTFKMTDEERVKFYSLLENNKVNKKANESLKNGMKLLKDYEKNGYVKIEH